MIDFKFKEKDIVKNRESGITLMALVVTIIILLILAGISIGMLSGDNSIIKQAGNAKTQTDIAEEKEILEQATVVAMGKSKYGVITKEKLDNELNKYPEIEGTEQNDKGIVVTFKSNRSYLVNSDGDVSSYSDIKIENLVVKDGNTVLAENCKSVQLGKALTINFDASISDGTITSITPNIAYTTSGEKSKTFNIIGKTSDGQEVIKKYTVNLKGYYMAQDLKVGDYIKYDVTYTDMFSDVMYDNSEISKYGWRVLDVGTKNEDGTYSSVKLISTGAPAIFNYKCAIGCSYFLANDSECENLYGLGLDSYDTQYKVSAGLGIYSHFKLIPFEIATTSNFGYGYSKDLQDKNDDGNITGDDFLISTKANEVYNVFRNEVSGNNYLNKIGGTYWVSTPNVNGSYLNAIKSDGSSLQTSWGAHGIRPVVSLISVVQEDENGNWEVK